MNPKELAVQYREDASKIALAAQKTITDATENKRQMTGEEFARFDGENKKALALVEQAEGLEANVRIAENKGSLDRPEYRFAFGESKDPGGDKVALAKAAEISVFAKIFKAKFNHEELNRLVKGEAEEFALSRLTGPSGGYLVPEGMSAEIFKALDDEVYLRRLCRVIPMTVPKFSFNTGDGIGTFVKHKDLSSVTATTPNAFGQVTLQPGDFGFLTKISEGLIRDSAANVVAFVMENIRVAYEQGLEGEIMTGDGVDGPTGMLTSGMTGKDIATGAGEVLIPEDVQGLPFELKAQYRRNAAWLMPRGRMALVAKLRSNDAGANTGRFLWEPDFTRPGSQGRLVGYPAYETEFGFVATGSLDDGDAMAIFGDFNRGYWIGERQSLEIRTLGELYAASFEVGYRANGAFDGKLVDVNALRRLNANG